MKKLCCILISLLLISCNSYMGMLNADGNIRNVSLGMSQQQVASVMGNHYEVLEARNNAIVWGYKAADNGIYRLRFVDGRLSDWNKMWLNRYEQDSRITFNRESDNSSTRQHLNVHRNAMLSTATSDTQKAAINAHMDAHERAVLGE